MQTNSGKEIIHWADLAKCLCISLVIMLHTEGYIGLSGWTHADDISTTWHTINMFLRPIRLPVLFLVSGMLASDSILRPHADTVRSYLFKPLYLYFLWGILFTILIPQYPTTTSNTDLSLFEHLRLMVMMAWPAWYLLALAGFYCVATLTRGCDLRWLLLACSALSLGGSFFEPSMVTYTHKLARCLVFFIAGVRLRDALLAYTAAATPRLLALSGLFFLGAGTISATIDRYLLPVDVMAAAFMLQLVGLLARRCQGLHQPARWLGQRTLYVYLLHFPLLALLSDTVRRNADPRLLDSWLAGMLYPIATTILLFPATLILGEAMRHGGFAWMFDLPRRPAGERKLAAT